MGSNLSLAVIKEILEEELGIKTPFLAECLNLCFGSKLQSIFEWIGILPSHQLERLDVSFTEINNCIKSRMDRGEEYRDDIKTWSKSRNALAERLIIEVIEKPEERKIPYLSRILPNTLFIEEIDYETANKIFNDGSRFSFQQLCILAMVGRGNTNKDFNNIKLPTPTIIGSVNDIILSSEYDELLRSYYLEAFDLETYFHASKPSNVFYSLDLSEPNLINAKPLLDLTDLGRIIYDLMDLDQIDCQAEIDPIATKIGWIRDILDNGRIIYNPGKIPDIVSRRGFNYSRWD